MASVLLPGRALAAPDLIFPVNLARWTGGGDSEMPCHGGNRRVSLSGCLKAALLLAPRESPRVVPPSLTLPHKGEGTERPSALQEIRDRPLRCGAPPT